MIHAARARWWWLMVLAIIAGLLALVFLSRPMDPQRMARRMQSQIEQVRGLKFKHDVLIQEQSQAEFQKHAAARLEELSAPEQAQVLRTLGLLASDETLATEQIRKKIESGGPAGEYDPYSGRLLVVKAANLQQYGQALDDLYAREFYRALLDQNFDLKVFLERHPPAGELDHDAWLARRIVLEGDALYGAVLWRTKQKLGQIPQYFPIDQALSQSSQTEELVDALKDPRMRSPTSPPRRPRRDPDGLPTFLRQLFNSMQRDAVLFAHAVRERGWAEFEKVYSTSPPVSTEQVLHPRKWFVRERPLKIEWPAFANAPAFADWELVEQNVLGELMLRTVFRVHYLSSMMNSAPAGWNGDRYAVFKRRGSGEMLLLLYTAWDDESAAAAFASSYRVLLKEKYAGSPPPVRILEQGRRVVIVEGGDEASLDALMEVAKSAREIADTAVER